MAGCALVVERSTKVKFPRAGEEGSRLDIGALERMWERPIYT
jgi:hypothetical protein